MGLGLFSFHPRTERTGLTDGDKSERDVKWCLPGSSGNANTVTVESNMLDDR